jgi:phosphoesterase RecJ-like protein
MRDRIKEIITDSKNVAVAAHVNPDGDAIGSILGTVTILNDNGIPSYPVPIKNPPKKYRFLEGFGGFFESPKSDNPDLLLAFDTGNDERLEDSAKAIYRTGVKTIAIDHHVSNPGFGVAHWVDKAYASTSMMLLELFSEMGYTISRSAATAYYTALVADTGHFTFSNTDVLAHEAAARLVQLGAEPVEIAKHVDGDRPIKMLHLLGAALGTLTYFCENRAAYICVTRKMQEKLGTRESGPEDIAQYARIVSGVRLGIFFHELDTGYVKVSFRGNDGLDVRMIAEQLGGGGHAAAAGCRLKGTLEEVKKRVFREVENWLR